MNSSKNFSQSSRIDFDEKEAKAIYYGIMATATKGDVTLNSPQGVASAADRFLASMDWNDCGNYRKECVAYWTKLFATDEVVYTNPSCRISFLSLTTCRVAQKLTFHLAAPMVVLTNSRIGTERQKQKIPIRCS